MNINAGFEHVKEVKDRIVKTFCCSECGAILSVSDAKSGSCHRQAHAVVPISNFAYNRRQFFNSIKE